MPKDRIASPIVAGLSLAILLSYLIASPVMIPGSRLRKRHTECNVLFHHLLGPLLR